MALTVGSLFSGIGGIDLGLERAGMVTRWFVEWDAHCQNVLRRHWPGLPVYGDITTVDWSGVEPVDVLVGGFPCQPVSNAGKRLGTDDERWLWPEFARAIRALRPRYVLVENVPALRYRGFGEVITDLAALGYDAEWDCIPAAAVGAPHLRDRIWLIAYSDSDGPQERGDAARASRDQTTSKHARRQALGIPTPTNAADSQRWLQPLGRYASGARWFGEPVPRVRDWPLTAEPVLGRGADGGPHRVDRLRALGNAVVPQVVEWIGRAIVAFDERRAA